MEKEQPRLAGKVAIVTGAGSSGPGVGTGKATAILFARAGAKVLLVDRMIERAQETLTLIHDEGGEASVFEADITRAADCQAMVGTATERYGGLHILMNNVAIVRRGTVIDITEEDLGRRAGGQPKGYDAHQQICRSGHDRKRRRLHHQHLFYRRAALRLDSRRRALQRLQSRRDWVNDRHGGPSWQG